MTSIPHAAAADGSFSRRSKARVLFTAILLFCLSAIVAAQPPTPPEQQSEEKKAREAFINGKFDDAYKSLQALAKTNPGVVPKVVMSRWMLEAKQGQKARLLLEQAAAEEPAHPEVLLTNAAYALNEGRITDAILSSEAALTAAGSPRWDADTKKRFQREARRLLINALNIRGDQGSLTLARTHLLSLLEADPKNTVYRQQLASTNFQLNRPDDAFNEYVAARKDDATLPPPELSMAELWARKADFPKAEEWYGKAAQAHPNSAAVHRGYASYLLDRGRADAAKAHIEAAKKLEPASRETKALTGLFARYTKDYATATAVFEELVRDHPNYAIAPPNLALVLAESVDANQKRRATELGEVFAKQNPNLSEAHAIYGYTLWKNGQMADAERELATAASIGSLTPDAAYYVAIMLNHKEKYEDAHKLLKGALELKVGFVFRAEAQALLNVVEKKLPPPKK